MGDREGQSRVQRVLKGKLMESRGAYREKLESKLHPNVNDVWSLTVFKAKGDKH